MMSITDRWRAVSQVPGIEGWHATLREPSDSLARNPGLLQWWQLLDYASFTEFNDEMVGAGLLAGCGKGGGGGATAQRISAMLPLGITAYGNATAEGKTFTGGKMPWICIGESPEDRSVSSSYSGDFPAFQAPLINARPEADDSTSDASDGEFGPSPMLDDDDDTGDDALPLMITPAHGSVSGTGGVTAQEMQQFANTAHRLLAMSGSGVKEIFIPSMYSPGNHQLHLLVIPKARAAGGRSATYERAAILRHVGSLLAPGGDDLALVVAAHRSTLRKETKLAVAILKEEQLSENASILAFNALGTFWSYRRMQSTVNDDRKDGSGATALLLPLGRLRLILAAEVPRAIYLKVRLATKTHPHNGSNISVWHLENAAFTITERLAYLKNSDQWEDRKSGVSITLIVDKGGDTNKALFTFANGPKPGCAEDAVQLGAIPKPALDSAENWRKAIFHGPLHEALSLLCTQKVGSVRVVPFERLPQLGPGGSMEVIEEEGDESESCFLATGALCKGSVSAASAGTFKFYNKALR